MGIQPERQERQTRTQDANAYAKGKTKNKIELQTYNHLLILSEYWGARSFLLAGPKMCGGVHSAQVSPHPKGSQNDKKNQTPVPKENIYMGNEANIVPQNMNWFARK